VAKSKPRNLSQEFSEAEISWLAGLLEGEGSFWTVKSRAGDKWNAERAYDYRYPKIVVNMTDYDVVERAAKMFGTSVYRMPLVTRNGKQNKQQWRAQISGSGAAAWMRILHPWLGQRRQAKINEILEEYARVEFNTESRRQSACKTAAAKRKRDNTSGQFTK
jgi:hypothetical protein